MTPKQEEDLLRMLNAIDNSLQNLVFTLRVLEGYVGELSSSVDQWQPSAHEYKGEDNE